MERLCYIIARITEREANYEKEILSIFKSYLLTKNEIFAHCYFTEYDIDSWES